MVPGPEGLAPTEPLLKMYHKTNFMKMKIDVDLAQGRCSIFDREACRRLVIFF
jgi:hypothetical protein